MSKIEEKIKEICESITLILSILKDFKEQVRVTLESDSRIILLFERRVTTLENKVKWLENDNGTLESMRMGFHKKKEVDDE